MAQIEISKMLKEYGGVLKSGILIKAAPSIAQGALVRVFKEKRVDRKKATEWVQNDTSLWDSLGPEYQEALKNLAQQVKNLDWLTSDFVIDSTRKEFPSVASLFLGWRKSRNWLNRQIEIIKKEIES